MPEFFDDPIDAGTLARGRITYFPVVPGRLEFTWRLRRFLLSHRPNVVAVELPESLEAAYSEAISRLPQMSVLMLPERDDEESAVFLPVEPADSFVEALRTAAEFGAETMLLEPATRRRPHLNDFYPEPFSMEFIGAERYVEAYRVHPAPRTPEMLLLSGTRAGTLFFSQHIAPPAISLG